MLLTSGYPIHLVPGSSSNQAEGLIILMNIFDISESPQFPHDHIKGDKGACSWWLEERQQRLYPNLSKIALDILTIPAMSAAPERLFSSAMITISDRRNRLHSDTTEAIECLKSWTKIQTIKLESGLEVGSD